jgi:hypothetical protein
MLETNHALWLVHGFQPTDIALPSGESQFGWRPNLMRAHMVLAAAMLLHGIQLSAQPSDAFATSRAYIRDLRGMPGGAPIAAPAEANVVSDGTPDATTITIARLREWLRPCRAGAAGYGGSARHAGHSGSFMYFECTGADAPVQTLRLDVVMAPDGSAVEAVDVQPGVPMRWLPPAPNAPGSQPTYPVERLPAYVDTGRQFIERIVAQSEVAGSPEVPMMLGDLRRRDFSQLTRARAGTVLRPCSIVSSSIASFSVVDDVPAHDAVRFTMKCDPASTAPGDLDVWTSFRNGQVDGMGIQTANDYLVPSAPATSIGDPEAGMR